MKAVMAAALLAIAPSARAEAHPLDTLAPGHWYEIPGSHLDPLFPDPRPAGNSGPAAVVDAWGGGGFDSVHERLFLWGGGHGDYGGNEIYSFDVATLKWSRPWGPMPVVSEIPAVCASTYAGGTPSARHTYDGIQFIPTTGKMWSSGGFRFCGNTGADNVTWLFDFAASTWVRGTDALEAVGTPTSAWDPKRQRVLYQAQNLLQAYDPATDQYTKLGTVDGGFWATAVSAVDVAHDLLVSVASGKLRIWNLSTHEFTSEQPTSGGARAMAGQPGIAWDPSLGRIVTWSGGTSVWSLDVATWTWFEHAPAADNTATPPAPVPAGTFGRFRFMPGRNAYVVANKTSDNVFFYKLTSGGGTPVASPPDAGGGTPVASPPDAGPSGTPVASPRDAGQTAAPDSAADVVPGPASAPVAGCSCAAAGPGRDRPGFLLLLLGAAAIRPRRRRDCVMRRRDGQAGMR
jgi:MYXO-CTERM domain-containing protein